MKGCFFAFNLKQLEEGKAKAGITPGETIYRGGCGLYGTREGLRKFSADTDAILARVSVECDPQDVYNYEFNNYECELTCDDQEAIRVIISHFGEEVARTVSRRFALCAVENAFSMP